MPKFFVPPEQIYDDEIIILGDDARHISASLRMKTGDTLIVCNKNKRDYECIISSVENGIVKAEIVSSSVCGAEPAYNIRLYQCLPKGEKMEYIIQKAVELGISSIVPVYSSRCIAKPTQKGKDNRDKKTERYNKIAYEAAQQSGRGIVPVVYDCITLERAFAAAKGDALSFVCYENENGITVKTLFSSFDRAKNPSGTISFFVGPEGGFSKEEVLFAAKLGIPSVSLGERILRTETASSFVLSALSYETEM